MKLTRFIVLLVLLSPSIAVAEMVTVEYSRFYSHLKKLDDESLNKLAFAFGFQNVRTKELCQITSVEVQTPKKQFFVDIEGNRFQLPTEKALKLAKAQVAINLQQQANQCDMSVQLAALLEKNKVHLEAEEMKELNQQFKAFFDEMGGFLSFLMPGTQGLVLKLQNADSSLSQQGLNVEGDIVQLSNDWISQNKLPLTVGSEIKLITAWVEN